MEKFLTKLTQNMLLFIQQLETKTLKPPVSILYNKDLNNLSNIFIEYIKKNIKYIDMNPQSIQYKYVIMSCPNDIDLIIINNPSETDLQNHLSIESIEKMKELKIPILIITNINPSGLLSDTESFFLI